MTDTLFGARLVDIPAIDGVRGLRDLGRLRHVRMFVDSLQSSGCCSAMRIEPSTVGQVTLFRRRNPNPTTNDSRL